MYDVALRAHSVRGERRIQRNANREVATQHYYIIGHHFCVRIATKLAKVYQNLFL